MLGDEVYKNCKAVSVIGLILCLTACSPPSSQLLKTCQNIAFQRSVGKDMNADDLGELTEACMNTRGYALNRDSQRCQHDRNSEASNRCYYRDNFWGRIGHQFSHL